MTKSRLILLVAGASLAFAAVVVPAAAQNCWTDVTVPQSCAPGVFHLLQFKNNCAGGQRTVNTCVKWITGTSAGLVNRLGGSAAGGQVATITPGLCTAGDIRYTYRADGAPPACP
ncbi:MAG TPA: hypothetical protein VMV19_21175 [Xanthobacteraceae bacterium]|nr:hypothetical protein [Xanthobacteraceae bacterium]